YSAGGFRVRIDIQGIRDVSPRGIELFGVFEGRDVRLSTPATSSTVVGMIAPSPMVAGRRVIVFADERHRLSIRPVTVPATPVVAKNVSLHGEKITVALSSAAGIRSIELADGNESHKIRARSQTIVDGELPTLPDSDKAGGGRRWALRARKYDGRTEDDYYRFVDYPLPYTGRARPESEMDG